MPSINLIWEQRVVRQKYQRITAGLLALVGVMLLIMVQEVVRTGLEGHKCRMGIEQCEKRIAAAQALADRNNALRAQITVLQPTVGLLQEAQRITLRWVGLLDELAQCTPDPKIVALNQMNFSVAQAVGEEKDLSMLGNLTVGGTARNFPTLTVLMRRLGWQKHIGKVRLSTAQMTQERPDLPKVVTFGMQAEFRVPEDEEKQIAAAAEAISGGTDPSGLLQKAVDETVLNRVPVSTPAAQ